MFLKRLTIATAVPVAMMLVAMVMRPVWRDEIWALYFSDTSMELKELMSIRMSNDTHPPLYFIIQHYWRAVSDSILWSKFFSLCVLVLGGFLGARLGKNHKRETHLFFLLCLGSYWVIYFMAEIRPYILLFTLCALSVLFIRTASSDYQEKELPVFLPVIWGVLVVLISLTHYYGALWMGLSGAGLGLHGVFTGKPKRFFAYGFATAIGLAPVCCWIYTNLGTINFTSNELSAWGNFSFGFNQFRRGITDKILGSNLAISLIAILALPQLIKNRTASDKIMLFSAVALVVIIFIIHVSMQPLIKERAFIVIFPAMIYLMARGVLMGLDANKIGPKLKQAVIWMAVISPFLFMSEYFKDREKMGEVRELFARYPVCQTELSAVYFRPSPQGDDFSEFYTNVAFKKPYTAKPNFMNLDDVTAQERSQIESSACPVKVFALNLPRGDKADHDAYRLAATGAGFDLSAYKQYNIGKGRNILYVDERLVGNAD